MLKDMISTAHVDKGVISVTTCNTCKVVIAQDMGNPIDLTLVISRVNGHISTPKSTFTESYEHEILTVNMEDGTTETGIVPKKHYSD